MKTKKLIIFFISSFMLMSIIIFNNQVSAQKNDIQYPIQELGNCQNQAACKLYCDEPDNREDCFDFAEKNNLMSQEEVKIAKKFLETGTKGPGGCEGKEECDTYCDNIDHIEECITFAEENDLIPAEELEEARKVRAAVRRGVKPPACKNKRECDVYCESPLHMEECMIFGMEAGFIEGKELEDVKKMLAALKRGIQPLPCNGKEGCDAYCQEPDNMEKCMTFGIEVGFMEGKELEDAKKMLVALKKGIKPLPCSGKEGCDAYCQEPDNMERCMIFAMEAGFVEEKDRENMEKTLNALKKGIKPPRCQGEEECAIYCNQDEHFEECLNFAEAAGFMSAEDAAMSRKTGGKGPGGCKGEEECKAFCDNPDNQETCFNFSKEHGLISEEDLQKMEEGSQMFRQSLEQAPVEVMDCLIALFGAEKVEGLKNGTEMPTEQFGEAMTQCYEKMPPHIEEMAPSVSEEMGCQNSEECGNWQLPEGQIPNEFPQGENFEGQNPEGIFSQDGYEMPFGENPEGQASGEMPNEASGEIHDEIPEETPSGMISPSFESSSLPIEVVVPSSEISPEESSFQSSNSCLPKSFIGLFFYIFTRREICF